MQISVALGADAVRSFVEDEELVLETGFGDQTLALGTSQHTVQEGARTDSAGTARTREFADEIGRAIRQRAFRGHNQTVASIREAAVPARDGGALAGGGRTLASQEVSFIELVVHVPAEHAVAEAAAFGQQAAKLLQADELAP